jgi:hypothetical protein
MKDWLKTLQKGKPKAFINLESASGIGDFLNSTSAIRHFKEAHPDHILTVVVDDFFKNEVLKNNPYIDFLVPAMNTDVHFSKDDIAMKPVWSFYEQHQHGHVCQSYNYYINGKHYDDLTMEMFTNEKDRSYVESVAVGLHKEKPLVAVSPAYTMYNRTFRKEDWQKLVNILAKDNTVVSVGGATDFELENVIDLRCKFKINQLPYFFEFVKEVWTVCSGMLHIAGCNPQVKIKMLSVGEFPSELHVPYRNGQVGWNCDVIEHECPYKQKCYEGHIKETEYQKQLKTNIMKFGADEPLERIKKYTAWHYCIKPTDKYSCARFVAKRLFEQL